MVAMGVVLAAIAIGLCSTAGAIKPKLPLDLEISAGDAELALGKNIPVRLVLVPQEDIAQAEIEFVVELGDVQITGPRSLWIGSLPALEPQNAGTSVCLTGRSKSAVRAVVHALDGSGRCLFSVSKALLFAASGDEVASGSEGFIALQLDAAKRGEASGASTKAVYDLEANEIIAGGAASQIEVSGGDAKAGNITVNGTVLWTDSAGNTHPARCITVEIRDANAGGTSELVATVTTGTNGAFNTVVDNTDSDGSTGRDVFVRVCAAGTHGRVVRYGAETEVQRIDSATTNDVAEGATLTVNVTANNTDDNNRAFSVVDALYTITQYASWLGALPPQIDIRFPGDGSYYSESNGNITLVRDDWADWDIVHHEFGHYFMRKNGIDGTFGGNHALTQNMSETKGKETGTWFGWGEGFPTYFGTSGQMNQNASTLSIPNVGDSTYSDTIDSTLNYSLEANNPSMGTGEDNELSNQRILWDLYDARADGRDEVALGERTVFNLANGSKTKTLSAFWNALIAAKASMLDTVRYGQIFMEHRVAPEPQSPADGTVFAGGAAPPSFQWLPRGGGPTYRLNKFKVQFWDSDLTTKIFESPEVNASPWTPSAADWTTILAGDDLVKWVVTGCNSSAPETGWYVSGARTIGGVDIGFVIDDTGSMSEEISGVRSALSTFITSLRASGKTPSINLITFKDGVTSRVTSKDLDVVQGAVSALYASGGGDCPEASVQALNLARQNVKWGGRVLFATDADPHRGLNIAGAISMLRAKSIRVDVLLSGSCSEGYSKALWSADLEGSDSTAVTAGSCNHEPHDDGQRIPPDCDDCGDPIIPPESIVLPYGAIAVFSSMAAETGGAFNFIPDVNYWSGSGTTRYNNTANNLMMGAAFPTLPTVTQNKGNCGTTVNIEITGSSTNFNASSALTFVGGGVTVNDGYATSATTYVANISIAEDAEQGFRDVVITTDLGDGTTEEAVGTGAFEILGMLGGATVTSVLPTKGFLGQTLDVIVTGTGTHFDATSAVDFGAGITVNSWTATDATNGVANITIDTENGTLGYHSLTVSTGDEWADENVIGPFLVSSLELTKAVATVESITPNRGGRGRTLDVAIVGNNTNFEAGATAASFSGTGITVNSTTVTDATHATVNITIDSNAPVGIRDVTMNTGSEVAAKLDAFYVENAAPTANAGPDQTVDAGEGTVSVTLDGSGSQDPDGAVVVYEWSGTPDPADVVGPTVVLAPGEYTFTLVVVDDLGARSEADTVVITVTGGGPEPEPVTYTLTITVLGQGSTDPTAGTHTYPEGTVVQVTAMSKKPTMPSWTVPFSPEGTIVDVTAIPAWRYSFTEWQGDATGNAATITVTMDGDKNVTAVFTKKGLFSCFGGSIDVDPGATGANAILLGLICASLTLWPLLTRSRRRVEAQ